VDEAEQLPGVVGYRAGLLLGIDLRHPRFESFPVGFERSEVAHLHPAYGDAALVEEQAVSIASLARVDAPEVDVGAACFHLTLFTWQSLRESYNSESPELDSGCHAARAVSVAPGADADLSSDECCGDARMGRATAPKPFQLRGPRISAAPCRFLRGVSMAAAPEGIGCRRPRRRGLVMGEGTIVPRD
jgi:hypothetical protein